MQSHENDAVWHLMLLAEPALHQAAKYPLPGPADLVPPPTEALVYNKVYAQFRRRFQRALPKIVPVRGLPDDEKLQELFACVMKYVTDLQMWAWAQGEPGLSEYCRRFALTHIGNLPKYTGYNHAERYELVQLPR